MQHILRCERQSDGSATRKHFGGRGTAPPRTPLGELTALPQTPSWWGAAGCPKNPIPSSRPFGPRFLPHSKISSDAAAVERNVWNHCVCGTWCACLGGSVGWGTVRTDRNGLQEGRGSIPGSAGRFRVRISGAFALRLISRAGKEGSTVSSIICDRWLILSQVALSY